MRSTTGNWASVATKFIRRIPDFKLYKESDGSAELFCVNGTLVSLTNGTMLELCCILSDQRLVSIRAESIVETKLPLGGV